MEHSSSLTTLRNTVKMESGAQHRIGELADQYINERSRLDPYASISDGVFPDHSMGTDYSHDGMLERHQSRSRFLKQLSTIQTDDAVSRVAHLHLTHHLERQNAYENSQEYLHPVRLVDGPLSTLNHASLALPTTTPEDWDQVVQHLLSIPESIASLQSAFDYGLVNGNACTRRELELFIAHCEAMSRPDGTGAFDRLFDVDAAPEQSRAHLERAIRDAHESLHQLAAGLRDRHLETGLPRDGSGVERFRNICKFMVGTRTDPRDLFELYWSEYQRLRAESTACAHAVVAGGSVVDATWQLDKSGVLSDQALRQHLRDRIGQVIADLDGKHFDIPASLRDIQIKEAPASASTAVWLTPPSEDGSHPAALHIRPQGGTNIPVWRYEGTSYFALVPGAALSETYLRFNSPHLNRAQKTLRSNPPSRGWAAYAGNYVLRNNLTGPNAGTRFALIQGLLQMTARIVVDIAYNCHYELPEDSPVAPGEICTYDISTQFMAHGAFIAREIAAQEVDRFVSSPGNAVSYRVAERALTRSQVNQQRALGSDFDPVAYHRDLLSLGPLESEDLKDGLSAINSGPR